jgi:hypothetical protein
MYLSLSDLMALGHEDVVPGMRRPNRGLIEEQITAPMADYWPDEQVAFRPAPAADPPPPARWNPIDNPRQPVPSGTGLLRNNRTGAEYVFNGNGQAQAQGPELDYTRGPVEVFGVGKGHYIKGEPMSAMVNGRRVDFGRDTEQEMKRDNANLLRAKTIQDMQRTEAETDRIRADTALKQQVKGAKAPAGWQFDPDGKLSRIPGGPADEKFMAQYYRDDHGVQNSIASMKNLTDLAAQVLKAPGLSGRFGVMGMFPDYPGGHSADAKVLLGRLKDVAGMSALEALKAAGNNGSSGLGAVTEFEHRLLQNQLASLDKAQSLKQAKDEITNLIAKTEAAVKRIEGHHARMYRGMQPPAPENLPPSSPTTPVSEQESSFDNLPDPATWPQGKVLRDTQTGQRLRVVNGKWEIQ